MIKKFMDIGRIRPDGYDTIKKKYLITNDENLFTDGYEKIATIDVIPESDINKYHYFLFFHSDDEYLYHIEKIIKSGGTFSVHPNAEKSNYVHANRNTRLALMDTLTRSNIISHYNEIVHGNICQAIEQTRNLEGDYIEIGVYKGGSAITAINYMRHAKIDRMSYFMDTYDGFNYEEAERSCDIHWNG
jgi:hypothetical protein